MKLSRQDHIHLEAAEGWLGLGDHNEANEELERISPERHAHPDVLRVRYEVFAKARKWEMAAEIAKAISEIVPQDSFGFVHMAFALHEMRRTKEAMDVLLPVVDKFPDNWLMCYNLACYTCQLGQQKEAIQWLEKAIELSGKKDIRMMAREDPDLEPLWMKISEI
jgi:tetratricopeptide (TPR) repeat protein